MRLRLRAREARATGSTDGLARAQRIDGLLDASIEPSSRTIAPVIQPLPTLSSLTLELLSSVLPTPRPPGAQAGSRQLPDCIDAESKQQPDLCDQWDAEDAEAARTHQTVFIAGHPLLGVVYHSWVQFAGTSGDDLCPAGTTCGLD